MNIYRTIAVCQVLGEKSFAWVIWNHSQLQKRKLRHREIGPASCSLLYVKVRFWALAALTPVQFSSVQSLSHLWLFATPWIAACQASLSITNSQSPPKPMSIESVMPSNHLILCRPLLLPPSIIPSIRVFSNESVLLIRWPKYWSFSFNISPSNEYPGLISFRMDWLDLLAVQGTLKSLLQHHTSKASILHPRGWATYWHHSVSQATQDKLSFPLQPPNIWPSKLCQNPTLSWHLVWPLQGDGKFSLWISSTIYCLHIDPGSDSLLPSVLWQWRTVERIAPESYRLGLKTHLGYFLAVWLSIHSPPSIHSAPNMWYILRLQWWAQHRPTPVHLGLFWILSKRPDLFKL